MASVLEGNLGRLDMLEGQVAAFLGPMDLFYGQGLHILFSDLGLADIMEGNQAAAADQDIPEDQEAAASAAALGPVDQEAAASAAALDQELLAVVASAAGLATGLSSPLKDRSLGSGLNGPHPEALAVPVALAGLAPAAAEAEDALPLHLDLAQARDGFHLLRGRPAQERPSGNTCGLSARGQRSRACPWINEGLQ